jgi:AAA family ATP:ADP antiporter
MVDPRTLRTNPEHQSQVSFPAFAALGEKPRGPLEKFLSIFADVRAGEGVTVLMMALTAIVILGLYQLLKPAREALILAEQGAKVKSYSAAGQAAVLLFLVPAYGWLATKMNRMRLIMTMSGFFALNLVLFWYLGGQGVKEGVAFYIWLGCFNVFIVAQFWAFANDIYSEGQGRRLFPFIGVGASLGAVIGAKSYALMVKNRGGTPYDAMLIACGLLLFTVVVLWLVNRREKNAAPPEVAREAEEPLGAEGGFQMILQDRYLLWIAVLMFLLNIVNTTGGFILDTFVTSEAERVIGAAAEFEAQRKAFLGEFFGNFQFWQNLIGLVLQLFFVSRIMRYAGVRGAMFVLPVLSFVSYSILAVAPILAVVRLVKLAENATDYSLMNTVRPALWLPTSREAKYKAKAAVDTFMVRFGDMAQAGVVFVGSSIGLAAQGFAAVNVALTAAWLFAAWKLQREHRRRTV